MRFRRVAGALLACAVPVLSAPAFAAPQADAPLPGRYAAELCVTTAGSAPGCGPVQLELRRDGSARVRVDDLVYQLQLHSSQVDVVLMHGSVQVDDFTVPYQWVDRTLRFEDEDRHVRYEVRIASSKPR
jgi:hypothetical protein